MLQFFFYFFFKFCISNNIFLKIRISVEPLDKGTAKNLAKSAFPDFSTVAKIMLFGQNIHRCLERITFVNFPHLTWIHPNNIVAEKGYCWWLIWLMIDFVEGGRGMRFLSDYYYRAILFITRDQPQIFYNFPALSVFRTGKIKDFHGRKIQLKFSSHFPTLFFSWKQTFQVATFSFWTGKILQ